MRDGCGVGIVGLGAALPRTVRTNAWWAEHAPDCHQGDDFVKGTEAKLAARGEARRGHDDPFRGSVERRVLEDHLRPSDLEAEACRLALESAGVRPADIDLLIGYSQVQDDLCPGNTGRVAKLLGLGRQVVTMGIDAGCASFLPQLTTAVRFIACEDHRQALLFQSSATSRITDYSRPASVLVGDGAVSQVVGRVDPGLGFVGRVQLLRSELCEGVIVARADGNPRWYDGGETSPIIVTSRDRDAGHQMGAEAPGYAREACHAVLERHGYTPDDVDFFVCAQAGAWFGEACAQAVGIGSDRIVPPREHFERYGHLLAGSAPLNLWVAWSSGRLKKGDLVLMYSPGVGFVQAATLVRWAMDPPLSGSV